MTFLIFHPLFDGGKNVKIYFNDERTNELTNSSAGIVFPFASDAENSLQRFNES